MISDSESDKDNMEFAVDEDQVNLLFGEVEKEVEDDWLQLEQFAQNYEDEETGPDIGATLATVVEKILKTRLSEEKMKTFLDAKLRLANVKMLTNPRLSPHIWAKFFKKQ